MSRYVRPIYQVESLSRIFILSSSLLIVSRRFYRPFLYESSFETTLTSDDTSITFGRILIEYLLITVAISVPAGRLVKI